MQFSMIFPFDTIFHSFRNFIKMGFTHMVNLALHVQGRVWK